MRYTPLHLATSDAETEGGGQANETKETKKSICRERRLDHQDHHLLSRVGRKS